MTVEDTMRAVLGALTKVRIPVNTEREAQAGVEAALKRAGISFRPQVRLNDTERPDVMVAGVAVEIKVKGSRTSIFRQLERYADIEAVSGIILVSSVAWPFASGDISGKPFRLHRLGENWL